MRSTRPLVRKLNRGEPAVVFTFGMLVAGGAVADGLWLVRHPGDRLGGACRRSSGSRWSIWPFSPAPATFVLLQFATLRLPSAKVMAYTYLTPSWVILWEMALGNGAPPGLVLGGVALTVVALLLLLRDEG